MTVSLITIGLTAVTVTYLVGATILSLRPRPRPRGSSDRYYYFIVPCLDEELVLANTLNSLLRLPEDRSHVIVVDDDSSDGTAAVARSFPAHRVTVVSRRRPHARRGKGAALNAALAHIRRTTDRSSEDVIVGIVDADGRLEPDVLDHVDPYFGDGRVGAVQLMVRILGRQNLLLRFQDFEFVSFATVLQSAREYLGSVGLGGNGQFTRLATLDDLGPVPWTDCLTEDLDLGLRIAIAGWENRFCADTNVSQQGLRRLRPLLRQRTRWLQGHMQCWKLAPDIVRSDLPNRAAFDLLYYLAAPAVLLVASILFTLPMVFLARWAWSASGSVDLLWGIDPRLLMAYALATAPALILGVCYWRRAGDVSLGRSLVLAHLLVVYNYIWYAAAWRALFRTACGRRGWTKTRRSAEEPDAIAPNLALQRR